jgi:hypothetical protein
MNPAITRERMRQGYVIRLACERLARLACDRMLPSPSWTAEESRSEEEEDDYVICRLCNRFFTSVDVRSAHLKSDHGGV